MDMSSFKHVATCKDCGKTFTSTLIRSKKTLMGRVNGVWQERCHACTDIAQHRPTIARTRTVENIFIARLINFPFQWQQFTAAKGDHPCWRIIVKGSDFDDFGAPWFGRLDIKARHPLKEGDIAHISVVRAEHEVNVKTLDNGKLKRLPMNDPDGTKITDVHTYLRMRKASLLDYLSDDGGYSFIADTTLHNDAVFCREITSSLRGTLHSVFYQIVPERSL